MPRVPSHSVITILLVDDHEPLRATLRRMLENHADLEVVADAGDGPRAIEYAQRHRPHIAVVDIGMKPMNGIEATAQILRHSPETAVLILTVYNHQNYVIRSLEAGARGYLLKDSLDEEEFVRAIHELRTGGRHFAASIAPYVPEKFCAGGRTA